MILEEGGRNFFTSVTCGIIFGVAWWIMIDIFAYYPESLHYRGSLLILPILLSTVSFIGNNLIPNSSLVEQFTVTRMIICHRMAFFFTMAIGFAGLLASIIVSAIAVGKEFPMYARIGVPILNGLILTANLLFKFGTTDGTESAF